MAMRCASMPMTLSMFGWDMKTLASIVKSKGRGSSGTNRCNVGASARSHCPMTCFQGASGAAREVNQELEFKGTSAIANEDGSANTGRDEFE